jgi:hypothetical protein
MGLEPALPFASYGIWSMLLALSELEVPSLLVSKNKVCAEGMDGEDRSWKNGKNGTVVISLQSLMADFEDCDRHAGEKGRRINL